MATKPKKKKKKLSALARYKLRLEWYQNFADYVQFNKSAFHNDACEYADNLEK